MSGRDNYTPKSEILFEPRALRMTAISQIYFPTLIKELETQKPYHETYAVWTNPENIITSKDREALYQQWEGEDFCYYKPKEEIGQVRYVGYYSDGRGPSPEFEIPKVWRGNKRQVFHKEGDEMGSDPKVPEVMEWQQAGQDEGEEAGDE